MPISDEKGYSLAISLLAVLAALALHVVIWGAGSYALKLLDGIRGNDGLVFEFIRELVIPAFAGYFSVLIIFSKMDRVSPHYLFFGFSSVCLVVLGIVLGAGGAKSMGSAIQFLIYSAALTPVIGAYIALKNDMR
jgi:hypothetical protein